MRQLGKSNVAVSPVALGTWPMAGVTSLDVNDADSISTIRACAELGINFIDTAYVYGPQGESEVLVRQALGEARDDFVIATKGGIHFGASDEMVNDARPKTLLRECDESLRRLGTDHVELYYLHSPDPKVPIAESAGAVARLVEAGKVRLAGASNCHLDQIKEFHAVCPLAAVQLPYSMLQRGIEERTIPWCRANNISVIVYWALMKGLLAGRMARDHELAEDDARRAYPMYQDAEWQRNQTFLDRLREIAADAERSVAELVVNWTMHQPGVTSVLCGARRRWQLEETASAQQWQLTADQLAQIEAAIVARGKAEVKRAFC